MGNGKSILDLHSKIDFPLPVLYGKITAMLHPLDHGQVINSPGCHFSYRVIGPCCRLFDRAQLPWPCCRLQWRGKEPSWRRIGRRLIVDLATKGHPTYSVEVLEQGGSRRLDSEEISEPMMLTLYWILLPEPVRSWWYSEKVKCDRDPSSEPPVLMADGRMD